MKYYNFIEKIEEIGIDWNTDTYDAGVHLNVYGAEKLTKYFGAILRDELAVPDRRDDATLCGVWSEKLAAYYDEKNAPVT